MTGCIRARVRSAVAAWRKFFEPRASLYLGSLYPPSPTTPVQPVVGVHENVVPHELWVYVFVADKRKIHKTVQFTRE